MRKLLLLLIIHTPLFCFSQSILGIHTELAQSLNYEPHDANMYLDSDVNLGLQYNG